MHDVPLKFLAFLALQEVTFYSTGLDPWVVASTHNALHHVLGTVQGISLSSHAHYVCFVLQLKRIFSFVGVRATLSLVIELAAASLYLIRPTPFSVEEVSYAFFAETLAPEVPPDHQSESSLYGLQQWKRAPRA